MSIFRPSEYRKSVYKIDLDKLKQKGIKAIMLDLDNTLAEWNVPEPTEDLRRWLEKVQALGFKICIVSNNSGPRVSRFAAKVGIPFICKAIKPRRKGFREAMARLGVTPGETAVVGDQIFTDVLGGNRTGAYTILVIPLNTQEFFGTKIVRVAERFVLRSLSRRGWLSEE